MPAPLSSRPAARWTLSLVCTLCSGSLAASEAAHLSLLPVPAEVFASAETLRVGTHLQVVLQPPLDRGASDDEARIRAGLASLERAANVVVEPASPPGSPTRHTERASKLTIVWREVGNQPQVLGEDEAYVLDIGRDGLRLEATNPLGVLRGLTTLGQWLQAKSPDGSVFQGQVRDRPRFAWRGVLLDTARHFVPVEQLLRQLDAMAAVKLNVLHWHLTDDQAFRLQIQALPQLHQRGADQAFYRRADVRRVVDHARLRGIRVVPEIDMPGHTESWLLGYPSLGAGPPPLTLGRRWGIFDAALDPSREQTFCFIDTLVGEVSELFDDAYLHVGGDEVTGKQWQQSATIQAFMAEKGLADVHALQTYFVARVAQIVAGHGKHMVGWDEVLQPNLPQGSVIQSWRSHGALQESLRAGYGAILSHGYYLGSSADAHYRNDPAEGLGAAQPENLLGGEVCQWSELVPASLLDASLWPRAAAVAERLWSPARISDVADMYRRLAVQSGRLAAVGVDPAAPQRKIFAELLRGRDPKPFVTLAQYLSAKRENWWPNFRHKRALDGFADALYPESEGARQLHTLTAAALDPAKDAACRRQAQHQLEATLQQIVAAAIAVSRDSAGVDRLRDANALASLAERAARLGLAALDAYVHARRLGPGCAAEAAQVLAQQEDRTFGADVAFAPSVALLVDAALRGEGMRDPTCSGP